MSEAPYPKFTGMSPQLLVADLERSISFYTQQLGFELNFRYEDFYAGIVKGGFSIHLKLGQPVMDKASTDLDITFTVTEINGLYAALRSKPVTITQALRDMPYGREFYIADPDGHVIAFLEDK